MALVRAARTGYSLPVVRVGRRRPTSPGSSNDRASSLGASLASLARNRRPTRKTPANESGAQAPAQVPLHRIPTAPPLHLPPSPSNRGGRSRARDFHHRTSPYESTLLVQHEPPSPARTPKPSAALLLQPSPPSPAQRANHNLAIHHPSTEHDKEPNMTRIIETFRTDFFAVFAATVAVVSTFLF